MSAIKSLSLLFFQRVSELQLRYFIALRFVFSVTLIAAASERLIDAGFIRQTSLAYTKIFPSVLAPALEFFLSESWSFNIFFLFFILLVIFYAVGFGGRWVLILTGFVELFFQHLSGGNIYGHEGFIHQFFILLLIYELCLGRQRLSQQVSNPSSFGAGLAVLMLRWQLAVLYFCAGVSKLLSASWNQEDFLSVLVRRPLYTFSDLPLALRTIDSLSPFLQASAPWLQIFLPLLLLYSKTRQVGIFLGFLFHLFVALLIQLYWFSFFMVGLYLVFYSERRKSQNNPSAPSI